jgi:hypothetical protein
LTGRSRTDVACRAPRQGFAGHPAGPASRKRFADDDHVVIGPEYSTMELILINRRIYCVA